MNNNIYSDNVKKHRRLKFGAFAVGLTAAVVALIVIINAIFSALAVKFGWFVDMTKEKMYGVTEQTENLLRDYNGTSEFSISIVFCMYADQLDSSSETLLVHNLAKQYAERFDFINVEYVDIVNHPDAVDKYLATSVSRPKTTSVYLVKNDLKNSAEEKKQSEIYSIASFYTADTETNEIWAFNGEMKLTAGILKLVGDSPIAYFVTGHGESTENSAMWSMFEDAGYEVKNIDLSKDSLEDAAKVMIINCPKTDYFGANDTVNEVKKVSDFINNFGGLMVFLDPAAGALPELEALLGEWGIAFERSQIRDFSNSLSTDGTEIVAEYTASGTGSQLTTTLRGLESSPKAVFNNAMPINFTYTLGTEGYYTQIYGGSSREVSAVFTTSSEKTAEILPLTGGDAVKGKYNLMTITVDSRMIENERHSGYVLAAGTAAFANDKYIGGRQYANRDVIYNVMKVFAKKTVPVDIDLKPFEDESLSITKAQANRLTVLYTVVPAIVVFAVGIVVYTRRRYL